MDLPENPPASTPLIPEDNQNGDDGPSVSSIKQELDDLKTMVDGKFNDLSEHLKLIIGQIGDKDVPKIEEVKLGSRFGPKTIKEP